MTSPSFFSGSICITSRHFQNGTDDAGVFVHWPTKPNDLVHQDLPALAAACVYGVHCELDELANFYSTLAVPTRH